jgi:hypothetical protein
MFFGNSDPLLWAIGFNLLARHGQDPIKVAKEINEELGSFFSALRAALKSLTGFFSKKSSLKKPKRKPADFELLSVYAAVNRANQLVSRQAGTFRPRALQIYSRQSRAFLPYCGTMLAHPPRMRAIGAFIERPYFNVELPGGDQPGDDSPRRDRGVLRNAPVLKKRVSDFCTPVYCRRG